MWFAIIKIPTFITFYLLICGTPKHQLALKNSKERNLLLGNIIFRNVLRRNKNSSFF